MRIMFLKLLKIKILIGKGLNNVMEESNKILFEEMKLVWLFLVFGYW